MISKNSGFIFCRDDKDKYGIVEKGGKCEIHEWQQKNKLLASELVSIA